MEQKQHRKESVIHLIYRLVMIIFGAACAAVAIELFLMPNKIIDGGIIGISLILDYLTPNIWWLSFSTLVVVLNIPFMYSGYKQIGKHLCYLRHLVL